jgi:hypothetical protein
MPSDIFQSRPPNLQRVMALLYRSGISCGLESDPDSGFTAWLGHAEEAKAVLHTNSLEEAAAWLDRTARVHYPHSGYVVARRSS